MGKKKTVMNKLLNQTIDKSIYDYIDKIIANFSGTKTEQALAIYIKLAELFWYNPEFVVDNDYGVVKDLNTITVDNNEIICLHWAIIYSKILDKYNIENRLLGNDEHLMVKVLTDEVVMFTDATRYGTNGSEYLLSDFTNTKLEIRISGIYSLGNKEKLEKVINEVYNKLNINFCNLDKLNTVLDNYRYYCYKRLKVKKEKNEILIDEKEIMKRIRFLNYFYRLRLDLHEVERLQVFSKYYKNVFEGFGFDNCRCITMCRYTDVDSHLMRLIVLADDNENTYYFLETNLGFVKYEKEELIDILVEQNINFKYDHVNVLGFTNNEVKILSKSK